MFDSILGLFGFHPRTEQPRADTTGSGRAAGDAMRGDAPTPRAPTRDRDCPFSAVVGHDSIHGADSNPTGRNVKLAARGARKESPSTTTKPAASRSWDPRRTADAEAIDGALTAAANAFKSILIKVLDHANNRGKRKHLVAATTTHLRSSLQAALTAAGSQDHVDDDAAMIKGLGAWLVEDTRAVMRSTVMHAACRALGMHWERQRNALAGCSRTGVDAAATQRRWLDLAVQALRDAMDRFDRDPGMLERAIATGDPVPFIIAGPTKNADRGRGTAALVSVARAVAGAMLSVLAKDFQLHVEWSDYMTLIRRVALPVVTCFLATKALNPNWTLTLVEPGSSFSPATMIDPPHELEWRADDANSAQRAEAETKSLVVMTTFPGIPARFGVADTVLHRAEVVVLTLRVPTLRVVLPSVTEGQPAGTAAEAALARMELTGGVPDQCIAICAADAQVIVAELYDLLALPVFMNHPVGSLLGKPDWGLLDVTATTIMQFLDRFHRIVADPRSDLNHELAQCNSRIALLRSELLRATVLQDVSPRLADILHGVDLRAAVAAAGIMIPMIPSWQARFVLNMNHWYWRVLTARMAGYMLVMPRVGDARAGWIECVAHADVRECGAAVGVALYPNVVHAKSGKRVEGVAPCLGFCDRTIPMHERTEQRVILR
ncbi:hypothetical protein AMAG_14127 [Allomyces macrogynus ATCC 38327]|uniref:Uncharacterized protein n=1 Tax=Allomyces macrogynus (strain ATCC 38327) TaxID=578462 RepID=A0A0L0T4W4_ALLM3|nr:hypothetical protein AMAG_14127 [Allomyces macrogynus ATCC 38327]|eukprot:KNE69569.1 hypothetical protein AMAG_14127 [Allomyces macrogynus ATCC 38327]